MSLVGAALFDAAPAGATSGFGCYRVNLGADDPLHVRAAPRADADSLGAFHSGDQPIIAFRGGYDAVGGLPPETPPELWQVHRAEEAACLPVGSPLGARWCRVALFDGKGMREGWAKRRFLDHSECP